MRRWPLLPRIALGCLLATATVPPAPGAGILNPSFETVSEWSFSEFDSGSYLDAYYSAEWASDGSDCLVFRRLAGSTTYGNYSRITQTGVDLTGVTGLRFDCQDTGIDDTTVPLQFLVDGVVVGSWYNNGWPNGQGSGWGHTAETYDIEILFADSYSGAHDLSIQLYQAIGHFPADDKYYRIDSLQLIPEPGIPATLALAALAISLIRRRRASRR